MPWLEDLKFPRGYQMGTHKYYYENYDLFTDVGKVEREKKLQETLVQIKHRYGKNAILKGMNALDFATAKKRNTLIGGHNAY